MKSHEIFQRMSRALADRIFEHFHSTEKAGYRAAIEQLAPMQKLRPVFILRRPKQEQFSWLKTALSRKPADLLAGNILQVWLVGTQTPLLCAFLDALGITHDERGMIEQLPPPPEDAALRAALDGLLAANEREVVAVYVQAFLATDEHPWPNLVALAETDPRFMPGEAA
jgi:hypothetical protein